MFPDLTRCARYYSRSMQGLLLCKFPENIESSVPADTCGSAWGIAAFILVFIS